MKKTRYKRRDLYKKDPDIHEMRRKLGLNIEEMGALFGITRSYMSRIESMQRNLPSAYSVMLLEMQVQFIELENGAQVNYRSLETRLLLNNWYKEKIPGMLARERHCRLEKKRLMTEMDNMKATARDTENAIIVYSTVIHKLMETAPGTAGENRLLEGLNLYKSKAYERLRLCWEPEQAKLQAKIEALAGEAKALRRFRLNIIQQHQPIKKVSHTSKGQPPG